MTNKRDSWEGKQGDYLKKKKDKRDSEDRSDANTSVIYSSPGSAPQHTIHY